MLQDDLLLSLPLLLQQYLQQEQVKDTDKVKQFSIKELVKINTGASVGSAGIVKV